MVRRRLTTDCEIPRLFLARQRFPRQRVTDVGGAVQSELERALPAGSVRAGAEVGITVGSRGIEGIAPVTRAVIDHLKSRGARPFIIPAMGSHGGATAEGQRSLIAHLGITERSMGAPIRDSMETLSLGRSSEGVEVFMARAAMEADGVILVNRVKPHTDYKGRIESGLAKMAAIGLGKYEGAREYHSHLFGIGLGVAIESAARRVLATGKVLAGLAILENAYHEIARIEAVGIVDFLEHEARLLEEARSLMGRLPLGEIDVLLCDRMGKNISGTGLDTNIIGRSVHGFVEGVPWQPGMPILWRIVVRDLSDESEGNAVGMGLADFATDRFFRKVNFQATLINAVTASAPANARLPAILQTDREALSAALLTSPCRSTGKLLVYVRDTLKLDSVYLSEACLPLVRDRGDIEIVTPPEPLRFDEAGDIVSPFESA